MIHAAESENFLALTKQNAERIGMVINETKTKILSINVARNSDINTFINLQDGSQVEGGEELKILGFVFGNKPIRTNM